jgi:DNA-binding SARP family transcriptional activator
MEINVLGRLEARHGDASIVPTAMKQRQVLSMLAIRAGQMLTVPTLIEELWGENRAPRSATQLVKTYILRLRQLLDEATGGTAKQVLITQFGGYALEVATDAVDVHRFRRLALLGERALESGDFPSASDILARALALWRGPALVDVRIGPLLGAEVERLEQSRLSVLESRIEADLQLGRRNVLGELAELTAMFPLHEKLCAQYMTALHLCGCKWKALEVYGRLRGRLVDELGVEPSLQVQQLHHAILNADTDPAKAGQQLPVTFGRWGAPRQMIHASI